MLLPALAVLTVGASVAGGALLADRGLAWALIGLIAAYLIVLAAKPTWTALAAIGPNPSEGGRFYGSSNLTTSILLTVALFAAGALGRGSVIPIALLSIVTVGWSRAGADGGGIVVLVAAFAALWILLSNGRLTARALAVAGALAVGVGLALVGLDAATGGSSHVTRKVGDGPIPLLDELGDRLHISIDRLTTSWHAALVFAIAIAALVRPLHPASALRRRRRADGGHRRLAAPQRHAAARGRRRRGLVRRALGARARHPFPAGAATLDSDPMRRLSAIAAALLVGVGVAAGCGYEGQTGATPETVEGSVPTSTTETTETTPTPPAPAGDAAAGKVVFTTNCGGCHTLSDAGTTGTVGPNLDDVEARRRDSSSTAGDRTAGRRCRRSRTR